MIWINGYYMFYIEMVWGGFKESGIGWELGLLGLVVFIEIKYVNINIKLVWVNWY